MQNSQKGHSGISSVKNFWKRSDLLYYAGVSFFILGVVLCVGALVQSSLSKINLGSPLQEISTIVTFLGLGFTLIFFGVNLVLRPEKRYMYLTVFAAILALVVVVVFYIRYVENWLYPFVTFGWLKYAYLAGILLLMGILFVTAKKKETEINILTKEMNEIKQNQPSHENTDSRFFALKGKLKQHAARLHDLQDELAAVQKDFEGYGWGVKQDREESDRFLSDLLTIADECEPFLEQEERSVDLDRKAVERIRMMYNSLHVILRIKGIQPLAIKPGEFFDPGKHIIVNDIDDIPENPVIKEVPRKGYVRDSTILRKAWVVVDNKLTEKGG